MRWAVVVSALWLAFAGPAAAAGLDSFRAGNAAAERGAQGESVAHFPRALDEGDLSSANRAAAHYNRGNAHAVEGRHDEAVADYGTALGLRPKFVFALINRGISLRAKGLYDRAIADFEAALVLAPDSARAYNNRGNVRFDEVFYDRAISDYEMAARLRPDNNPASHNRDVAIGARERYDAALARFDDAVESHPGDPARYRDRGVVRFNHRHFAGAVLDFVAAVEIDPRDSYNRLWLYLAETRAGRNGAERLAQDRRRLDLQAWPGPLVDLFLDRVEPEALLARARDDDPEKQRELDCVVSFYLGQYYLLAGDRERALELFRRSVDTGLNNFLQYRAAEAELRHLGS